MPYNPGVEYRGGDYLFQGITGAARGLAGGLDEWQKKHDEIQQKLQESGVLFDYATKHGYATPEQITKYAAASASEKANMAQALAKTITLDQADAQFKAEQDFRQQQLGQAWKIAQLHAASAGGGGMTPEMIDAANRAAAAAGMIAGPTSRGSIQYLPKPRAGGGDKHSPGETYYDPANPTVPAGVWESGDKVKLFRESDPLKEEAAAAMKRAREAGNQTPSTPSKPFIERNFGLGAENFFRYGPQGPPQPTPAPLANAAPTVPPVAPQGATVSPAPQLSAADQQALAWTQQNPNDPRAAAILRKLGY